MLPFSQCKYSAFISYAFDDDAMCFDWITHFHKELTTQLRSQLRRTTTAVPEILLASLNGPVAGNLAEQLKMAVDQSFAMIIVVHQSYVESDWCFEELREFRNRFGAEGMAQRLYIVALSTEPMEKLRKMDRWRELGADQCIWLSFARPDGKRPLPVYSSTGIRGLEFLGVFERLCDDMATKIRASVKAPVPSQPAASLAATPRRLLFGIAVDELKPAVERLKDQLTPLVASIGTVDADTRDATLLAAADMLVLPFNDAEPLMGGFLAGGHLALQQNAWTRAGKPKGSLVWLDMRHVPASHAASRDHEAFIAGCRAESVTPERLLERFSPKSAAPSPTDVIIYIESNNFNPAERHLWQHLGDTLMDKWKDVLEREDPPIEPKLRVIPSALPVDRLHEYSHLDDGDGFVLLWGNATADSLREHIRSVEQKVTGSRVAPGIVAYLMPPRERESRSLPAYGWNVLRFANERDISLVPEEQDDLQQFLRKVLKRKILRQPVPVH
jgi:hypothetical protein